MAFLDNLSKKIGSVAEVAADKAKDLSEIAKLNVKIASEQKQIESQYIEIGKLVFDTYKDDPESPVAGQCRKIVASQNVIAECNAKIEQIKGENAQQAGAAPQAKARYCSNCGAAIPDGCKFCPSCGTPCN
jgi:hypothetical protein